MKEGPKVLKKTRRARDYSQREGTFTYGTVPADFDLKSSFAMNETQWEEAAKTQMGKYVTGMETDFILKSVDLAKCRLVIDIGSEAGRFSLLAAKNSVEVVGVDLASHGLKRLRQRNKSVNTTQADARNMPMKGEVFDAIFMIEVLDYIPELETALAECYRTLRPEASLVLSFGNRSSLKSKLRQLRGKSYLHRYRTVVESLRKTGFEIDRIEGFNWLPFGRTSGNPLIPLLAKVEKRFGLKRIPILSPWVLVHATKPTANRSLHTRLLNLEIRKKAFFRIAKDSREYLEDVTPSQSFLSDLEMEGVDIFSFIERSWCTDYLEDFPFAYTKSMDNVAILEIESYEKWWKNVKSETRTRLRKALKNGVTAEEIGFCEKLVEGIWRIYNETPIRQNRSFPHYGATIDGVRAAFGNRPNSTYIVAELQDEIVGFAEIDWGDNVGVLSQLLSLTKHFDKGVNNSLVAKAIEMCSNNHTEWLIYARMGNHPSLDLFKRNNGFYKCPIRRYYIPLTKKGKIAVRLGLHRDFKDAMPESVKPLVISLYNWASRTKTRARALSKRIL